MIKMHFESEDQIINKLKELLAKDPELLNKPINLTKDTLLHYTAYHKKAKLTNFLLERGANKNAENTFKLKPRDVVVADPTGQDKEVVEGLVKLLS